MKGIYWELVNRREMEWGNGEKDSKCRKDWIGEWWKRWWMEETLNERIVIKLMNGGDIEWENGDKVSERRRYWMREWCEKVSDWMREWWESKWME